MHHWHSDRSGADDAVCSQGPLWRNITPGISSPWFHQERGSGYHPVLMFLSALSRKRMQHSRSSSHWSRWISRLALLAGVPALLLAACDVPGSSSVATTTTAACSAHYVAPTVTSSGGLTNPITNGGGNVPDGQAISLNIALNVDYADLEKCTAAIYDPSSSEFGHYLSPQDIAARFSPPASDVQKLTDFLTGAGLQVQTTFNTGAALSVAGTVAQVNKAFGIQLVYSANKQYYGPDRNPTIPANAVNLVNSISGLNTQGSVHCNVDDPNSKTKCSFIDHYSHFSLPKNLPAQSKNRPADDCTLAQTGTPGLSGTFNLGQLLTWKDLKSAYGLNNIKSDGSGTSIGMVEFDTYAVPDVAAYMTCAGTKPARALDRLPVVNVDVKAGDPPAYTEDRSNPGAGEATLDMEMAAGMTSATTKIIDYYAPNNAQWETELLDILHKVAADKQVTVLSISYGDFERDLSSSYMSAVNDAMKLLASEGISVFVASGDCAAYGSGQFGSQQLSFPASAPYAIAVGGTTLSTDPLAGGRTDEQTWLNSAPDHSACQNTWGSGGGLSVEPSFTLPAWQQGTKAAGFSNTQSNGQRQVPDVSAAAINISFYYSVGGLGLWLPVGGTSAAAPIWAAGIDVVNQALTAKGKPTVGGPQTLYTLANGGNASKVYNDITKGNYPNLYPFTATTGWDYVTGWGSPNFDQIFATLSQ
jgi:kumamolisin